MSQDDPARDLEILERLHEITAQYDLPFEDKVQGILSLGAETFELPLALMSRIEGDRYTIEHAFSTGEAPAPGTEFELGATYCCHTLRADGPTAFHHAGESEIASHPCYQGFGLESYIGTPIVVGGERYGTLNFSGPDPRPTPFHPRQLTLIRLFAQWLGTEVYNAASRDSLESQKALFEALFQNGPDAMVLADPSRRIVLVNKAFVRMFGYAAEEAIGRTSEFLYADPAAFAELGRQAFNEGVQVLPEALEINFRRKDGSTFVSETIPSVIRDGQGAALGFLGQVRDITERKQIERIKDELISTVSHELRTPLTAIRGGLGLMVGDAAGALPASAEALAAVALKNCEHMIVLLNDILDVEKLVSGRVEFDLATHSGTELVRQSLTRNEQYARQQGTSFQLVGGAEQDGILVDPDRFEQVLNNLLSNAAKFTAKGSVVEVELSSCARALRVSVRDRGPGVPADFQPALFDRFTQADASDTRKVGGTGLGLSIAKSLVDAMGGEIGYRDRLDGGAEFYLEFPLESCISPA